MNATSSQPTRRAKLLRKDAIIPWSWIDNMTHGVVAVNRKGVIIASNRPARALIGLRKSRGDADIALKSVVKLLDGESRTEIRLPTARSFARSPAPRFFYKSMFLGSVGNERVVNAAFSPLRNAKGGTDGVLMVFQDVSDDAARECLLQNRKEMEVIGVMARNIAGDFGHWISVISGHAARISENLLPNTRAHEEALGILAASENAGDIVKRLMGMTTATAQNREVKIESVNLGEIVGNAITLCRDMRPATDVSFNIRNLNLMTFAVKADAALLLDCLTHIFTSSTEAMPRGGKITLGAGKSRDKKQQRVILRIRDQSDGLHLPHGDTLAAIQADAGSWGGEIQVQKRPGKGIAYRLFIPLAESVDDEEQPAAPKRPLSGGTVLLADDDESARKELRAALAEEGYSVLAARDGNECLDLYKRHFKKINLIVVDFMMPGQDARQLLRAILALDPTASIIVMSGFSRDYVRGQIEQGAWGFMQKPIETRSLLDLAKQMLARKTQHESASRKRLLREGETQSRTG